MDGDLARRVQRLEDIQEIVKLKARYCNGCDGGWDRPTHDHDAVAALFVEDGTWDARPHGGFAVGRQAVREIIKSFRPVPFATHNVMTPIIEVDGDRATGEWHALITLTLPPDNQSKLMVGIYHETYVRTAEGWRFKSLRFSTAAYADYPGGWAK